MSGSAHCDGYGLVPVRRDARPSSDFGPLRFQSGDTLVIRGDGDMAVWKIVKRKLGGWELDPMDGRDHRTWSDEELGHAYRERRITHRPCNVANLSAAAAETIERAWEHWPAVDRRKAERRLTYLKEAAGLIELGWNMMDAYAEAARRVHAEHAQAWGREDRDEAAAAAAVKAERPRRGPERAGIDLDAVDWLPDRPNPQTIRLWYLEWDGGGRDLRLLLPRTHRRGHRGSRFEVATAEGVYDTYKCMDEAIRDTYLVMPRRRKDVAFARYQELCAVKAVPAASQRTFRLRLKNRCDARTEYAARYGKKAAYLRFNVFERTKLPERPLQEVEVDHCLIDLIAIHPVTGARLGRPWLTVIIDRATRAILGAHISFSPPSYASLMRCMANAIWPKDLDGIEGLLHDWPCHGVWDLLFTDNGKEFHSAALKSAEAMLGFTVVPLPAKHPWLKGMIERLWRKIGVRVYSLHEGSTQSRTADHYDPVKRAELTLDEIRQMTVRWIVNEYHETPHETLGCSPRQKWLELTALYPVRPVRSYDDLVRMTGEVWSRKIENVGVRIEGHLYVDIDPSTGAFGRKLTALRERRGGLERNWTVRRDPFDIGEAWILDDDTGEWIVLLNTEQDISRGVSSYQHRLHKLVAKKNVLAGLPVTVLDIAGAKRQVEGEAVAVLSRQGTVGAANRAARYATDPGYFTAMPPGPAGRPIALPAPPADLLRLAPPAEAPAIAVPVPVDRVAPPAPAPVVDFDKLMEEELSKWE